MLSPDSTPGLFRWYLDSFTSTQSVQVSWPALLHRYRNVANRAFHQFGVTFLNVPLTHHQVPTNDGGLALGQAVSAAARVG